MSIAQVSRIYKIKYTTVRSILRTYKATGRTAKLQYADFAEKIK
jgi:hypothetical protein